MAPDAKKDQIGPMLPNGFQPPEAISLHPATALSADAPAGILLHPVPCQRLVIEYQNCFYHGVVVLYDGGKCMVVDLSFQQVLTRKLIKR